MQPKCTFKPKLWTLPQSLCVGRRKRGSAVLHRRRAPRRVTVRRSADDDETVYYDAGRERLAAPSLATTRCSRRMPSHAVQGEYFRNNQNQSQTHFRASPTPTAQQLLADTREGATAPFHRNLYNRQMGQRRNNALDRQNTIESTKGETEPSGHRACSNVCEVDAQKTWGPPQLLKVADEQT